MSMLGFENPTIFHPARNFPTFMGIASEQLLQFYSPTQQQIQAFWQIFTQLLIYTKNSGPNENPVILNAAW